MKKGKTLSKDIIEKLKMDSSQSEQDQLDILGS